MERVETDAFGTNRVKCSTNPPNIAQTYINLKQISAIVCFVCFALLTLDIYRLFSTNVAVGIDGYYYVLQIQSYVNGGVFYFPTETPLTLIFFSLVNGPIDNPVISIKFCAALFETLLAFGIFAVSYQILNNHFYALIASLLYLFSGLHLYLFVEYLNQLGALTFLIWSIFFLVKYIKSHNFLSLSAAISLLIVSTFSHRSMLPIVATLVGSLTLFVLIKRVPSEVKQLRLLTWFAIPLAVLSPLCLKLFPFSWLPLDVGTEITTIPNFPSHFATLPEIILLICTAPVFLWLIIFRRVEVVEGVSMNFIGTIATWTLLITLNPFLSSGLGFLSVGGRLRTLACIQVSLLLPALMRFMWNCNKTLAWGTAAFSSLLMLWSLLSPSPHGIQQDFLKRREQLITSVKNSQIYQDNSSFVVAEHGDQFLITATTGTPSSQRFPTDPSKFKDIYWLISGVPSTMVDEKMTVLFRNRAEKSTVLTRHDENWKQRLTNTDLRRHLATNNSHLSVYLTANPMPNVSPN